MTKKEWHKLDKKIEIFSKNQKDWKCEICGRSKEQGWQIHHHHYIGRTKTALRWVNENIFVVCYVCHKQFEEDTNWAYKTGCEMRGEKWRKLLDKIKVKQNLKTYEENLYLMDKGLEEIYKSYK